LKQKLLYMRETKRITLSDYPTYPILFSHLQRNFLFSSHIQFQNSRSTLAAASSPANSCSRQEAVEKKYSCTN
jgi:hypothetical protein